MSNWTYVVGKFKIKIKSSWGDTPLKIYNIMMNSHPITGSEHNAVFSVDPLETLYYDYKLDSKILKASIKIKGSLRDKLLEDTCTDVDNFIKSISQDTYLYGKIIVSDCPPDLWANLPKGFKVKTLKLKDDKTKWI